MILILIFLGFFALGVLRARRAGGNITDQLRYGFTHGLPAVLVVYAVATIGDWQGFFN
ncbi:MAG: hypothetical protein ACJAVR_002671 [Paracoccaceae bacterium]|jgi:hypothetical protein